MKLENIAVVTLLALTLAACNNDADDANADAEMSNNDLSVDIEKFKDDFGDFRDDLSKDDANREDLSDTINQLRMDFRQIRDDLSEVDVSAAFNAAIKKAAENNGYELPAGSDALVINTSAFEGLNPLVLDTTFILQDIFTPRTVSYNSADSSDIIDVMSEYQGEIVTVDFGLRHVVQVSSVYMSASSTNELSLVTYYYDNAGRLLNVLNENGERCSYVGGDVASDIDAIPSIVILDNIDQEVTLRGDELVCETSGDVIQPSYTVSFSDVGSVLTYEERYGAGSDVFMRQISRENGVVVGDQLILTDDLGDTQTFNLSTLSPVVD